MDQHLLSIILLTPLAGLAVLLFIPGKNKDLIRLWANLVGVAGYVVSLPLVSRFQLNHPGYQFEEAGRSAAFPRGAHRARSRQSFQLAFVLFPIRAAAVRVGGGRAFVSGVLVSGFAARIGWLDDHP